MIEKLPEDWFEEHDGQRLVLNHKKVLDEINRLRKIIEEMEEDADNAAIERDLLT